MWGLPDPGAQGLPPFPARRRRLSARPAIGLGLAYAWERSPSSPLPHPPLLAAL